MSAPHLSSRPSPEISVVTATILPDDRLDHIGDLYRSLCATTNLAWEWIVVIDGPTDAAFPIVGDPRVRVIALAKNVGQASAVNLGLLEARGAYVITPDDDDSFTDGGLAALHDAVTLTGASWASGHLIHQRLDASGAWYDDDTWTGAAHTGYNRVGDPWRAWTYPSSTLPLAHTTMLVDTDLAHAVGGLQAIGQGQGLGYVMAVTSTAPGWILDRPVYRYRQHPGQVRKTSDFMLMEPMVREAAWQRGRILAQHHEDARGTARGRR